MPPIPLYYKVSIEALVFEGLPVFDPRPVFALAAEL
jgi:hypothetical protein